MFDPSQNLSVDRFGFFFCQPSFVNDSVIKFSTIAELNNETESRKVFNHLETIWMHGIAHAVVDNQIRDSVIGVYSYVFQWSVPDSAGDPREYGDPEAIFILCII